MAQASPANGEVHIDTTDEYSGAPLNCSAAFGDLEKVRAPLATEGTRIGVADNDQRPQYQRTRPQYRTTTARPQVPENSSAVPENNDRKNLLRSTAPRGLLGAVDVLSGALARV